MSSCRTAPTSTIASSTSLPSRTELPVVIACGALGGHIREIAARHGWQIELHCLPALLHNRPGQITIHAERIARRAIARRRRVALAYADPGTYVLTDYLVRSFQRTVVAGLGLDAHPELWPDYFRHYRRVVWLAQDRSAPMHAEAEQVAARFGLPLTVIETGTGRLEAELARLVGDETGPCTETAA